MDTSFKFLLDRGAQVRAILTSTNYFVSLLVQGGLKIACRVEISMPPTKRNKQITDIYKELVDLHHNERKEISEVKSF